MPAATPAVCPDILPCAPCQPAAAAAAAGDANLIVEDDDCVAGLLKLLLAPFARRLLRARDGAEALRLFQKEPRALALVIMDCSLPDTHGGSLSLRMRHAAPGLPVLLTSGRPQPALLSLLAADGPAAFLAKPFRPGEAIACVRALLGARAAG
jgi:DNA-binding response OmpR family regulator